MKKLLAMMLASVILLGVTSCGGNNPADTTETQAPVTAGESAEGATDAPEDTATEETAAEGDILNISLATTPETIDPNLGSALDSGNYANHLFEGLMRYKWDGTGVEFGMAESYEVSDDGLVWTFKLRDSQWSDGQPVKAQDFVFSWQRLVDPEVAAPYNMDMGKYINNGAAIVEGTLPKEELGVKAVDDKTLEVTLQNPTPYFDQLAAFATFSPLRQDTIEANGDNWTKTPETYLSNGPFKMLSYTPDDRFECVPNPGYWDAASVKPAQINWLFLSDDNAELAAFRSGELDYDDVPPEEEVLALDAEGYYGDVPELGTYYISYNTQVAPMDNVLVRKALTLAIDTAFIADTIRNGNVKAAEAFIGDGFTTSGHSEAFRDNWRTYVSPSEYEANKSEAQAALAEAGYPNGEGFPKLEYLYNENTTHSAIGEALQQMWKDVLNINVELKVAEWESVLQDRRNGNFQISRNGWIADYNDPATMLDLFTSGSGNNDGKYNNPEYDAKMDASNKESDPAKRNQLLHEAEDILIGEDWAMAPIYYYTITWAVNPNLKDWGVTPLGYKFFQRAYIEK